MRRANGAIAEGRFEAALTDVNLALSRRNDSIDALNLKGVLLAQFGRTDDAIWCFDRALDIAPESIECHYNKAGVLQSRGRHGEALAAYDRALALKPDMPEALNNRGLSQNALECFEDAFRSTYRDHYTRIALLECLDRVLKLHNNAWETFEAVE